MLLFLLLAFGILIWAFERKRNPGHFRKGIPGIGDGLWWSMVTLTTVGYGDKSPKSAAGKLVAMALMLLGLLFISGLTAVSPPSLTVDRLSGQVDGLEGLKAKRVGTVRGSSAHDYLRSHLFRDIVFAEGVVPGLEQLKAGRIEAFVYDEPILRFRLKENAAFDGLEQLPFKFDAQFYAFALRPGLANLEPALSARILEITESPEWGFVLNEYGLGE